MQLKQRDRPRKRGLKAIKVIAVVLTAVLSLGSLGIIHSALSDSEPKKQQSVVNTVDRTDTDGLIVMPENRTVIYQDATPLQNRFRVSSGSYTLVDNHMVIGSDVEIASAEILLGTHPFCQPGFVIADYTHIKIEFDVFNYLQTSAKCGFFYLLSRDVSGKSDLSDASKIYVSTGGPSSSQFKLTTRSGKQFVGEEFKIEYLIEVDKQNPQDSDIQVFINGEMVEEMNSINSIGQSWPVRTLCEVRFVPHDMARDSSIGFSNLLVTGCK